MKAHFLFLLLGAMSFTSCSVATAQDEGLEHSLCVGFEKQATSVVMPSAQFTIHNNQFDQTVYVVEQLSSELQWMVINPISSHATISVAAPVQPAARMYMRSRDGSSPVSLFSRPIRYKEAVANSLCRYIGWRMYDPPRKA